MLGVEWVNLIERRGRNQREKLERELVVKREEEERERGFLKLKERESSTKALKLKCNRLQVYIIDCKHQPRIARVLLERNHSAHFPLHFLSEFGI